MSNKNDEENNFSFYNYFISLNIPFRSARMNMWSLEDRYNYIPLFKFRFINKIKGDKLYLELEQLISSFKGNHVWVLYTDEKYINYIIKPKELILEHKFIDECIEDVPKLLNYIKKKGYPKSINTN